MNIGIDARMLGPKQGGIGRYVEQLVKHFDINTPHHGNPTRLVVFLRKDNWNLVPESSKIKKVLADIPWYGWREQVILSKIIKKEKIDLMHFPHWNIPIFYNKPFIVTIHDLLLLHYPTREASTLGPISYFFKNIIYRAVLNHAIKKSKHIITPSEFTKKDIIETFKISAEKITAIHLAPVPNLDLQTPNSEKNILNKYKIAKPYILYVGVAYPHKNLKGLIDAWKIFCDTHGDNYKLVMVGRNNYFYKKLKKYVYEMQEKNTEKQNVIFTGFVSDEELPTLYQNASLYVFPSFYEGFGLPPLEAMQYGVPVASSQAGSLPEVLGNAAYYFNPSDIHEITNAIWKVLTDEKLRQNLNKNCAQLIHNFSWKKTVKDTSDIYKKML